ARLDRRGRGRRHGDAAGQERRRDRRRGALGGGGLVRAARPSRLPRRPRRTAAPQLRVELPGDAVIGGVAERLQHEGRFYGKYSGVVVDGDDDEKTKRGWVKAKVPSVLAELEVWCRPCVPYGHFFVPPTGTKLWVEFEGGDGHYPIWVGTWFADGEPPP